MKHGKKYVDSKKLVDKTKLYDLEEACTLCVSTAKAKFDETVELHVRLGVDSRHADQQVRGAVVLPHGTGKNVKVLVIAKGDKEKEALEAGADLVGAEDMVAKIQNEGPVADIYDTSIMKIIVAFLIIIFVEFATTLQSGFTGIILGHKMNNNKLICSIAFGFITYMFFQIFGVIALFAGALFSPDLMNLFITNQMVNMDMIKLVIYLAMGFYSLCVILGYIFNIYMFNKGVNVD